MVIISPFAGTLYGQNTIDSTLTGLPVHRIEIDGNRRTKSYIIIREMKSRAGTSFDPHLLEEDRNRIQNLNLFNRVSVSAFREQNEVVIYIRVVERWYLFPYPILFLNDRDWSKLSYGAGLSHTNFRGRAEVLSFTFLLGYNPVVSIDYSNPWIGKNRLNLYTEVNLFIEQIRNKHFLDERVTEKHVGGQWTLGKRFGYHTFFSVTMGYKDISLDPLPEDASSVPDFYTIPYMGMSYIWDRRDLKEYPGKGWMVWLWLQKMGLPSVRTEYLRFGWDLRAYLPLPYRSTLALRSFADLSSGEVPVFDRVYLGYSKRIRGHFYERFAGEHVALWSLALRFPVIPVHHFKIADDPYLHDLKFGVSMGFFVDTGLTWGRGDPFLLSRLVTGYGYGIHLHLPYIDLLRFEIGLNESGRAQFIVDLFVDI